jgi:PAS domain S-box-containing protein
MGVPMATEGAGVGTFRRAGWEHMDPRVARLVKAARQSFEASEEALLALDGQGRRVYSNPAFDTMVGWEGAQLEGRRPPFPYWDPDVTPRMLEQLRAMFDGRLEQLGVRAVRGRFARPDGESFDVVMNGYQLRDGSGETLLNLCLVKAIAMEDSVGIARWLSRNVALQRFRDAVMRLDGALDGFVECPPPEVRAPAERLARLPGYTSLTTREREVLRRVVEGLRVTHVADDLGIQPATVRNHLKAIFRKTGLHSQAQLVEAARHLAAERDPA